MIAPEFFFALQQELTKRAVYVAVAQEAEVVDLDAMASGLKPG